MPIVLVVDDSSVDRLMFKGIIERLSGFSVVEAENGMDALEQIVTWNVDLIVTDLQMPIMNGLDLVKQVRLDFPRIPVVLATGHGSNEIANEALANGAAGYVPKSRLNELLPPTLRNIESRRVSDENFSKLIDCAEDMSFRFILENDISNFTPLIDLCKNLIEGKSNLDYMDTLRVGIAIEQALHNAMFRGNLEIPSSVQVPFGDESPEELLLQRITENLNNPNFCERKIYVNVNMDRHRFKCLIRDDGNGFDPRLFDDVETTEGGRGLVLMKAFVDQVSFNESGNEVVLTVNFASPSAETASSQNGSAKQRESEKPLGRLVSVRSGREVALSSRKLVLGSGRSCHIAISGKNISRHHCLLFYKNDSWHIKDLNSQSGVFVNGEKVDRAKLEPDDQIHLGDRELKIEF